MDNKELQKSLRRLAKASSVVVLETAKIADHCLQKYGITAHDIDNDDFLDACCGNGGCVAGMTTRHFHESMIGALDIYDSDTSTVVGRKTTLIEREETIRDYANPSKVGP